MIRYAIVTVVDGSIFEYGRKVAILPRNKRCDMPNGIYIAKICGKFYDRNGKRRSVVKDFVSYNNEINMKEQQKLYSGIYPEIAKKYLFLPSDHGYCEISEEQRNAILNCDELNLDGMTDIYKFLHQRYLRYLLDNIK